MKLDRHDQKILYILDHGGRLSFSEIARQVGLGRDLVEYRITRMQNEGVITGFRTIVNPYKIGLTLIKTYLRIADSGQLKDKFIKKLKNHPKVYWFTECDGEWDIIFSLAARSIYEFSYTQREIMNDISSIIIASEVYPVVQFRFFRLKYLHKTGTHYFQIGGEPGSIQLDPLEESIIRELDKNARCSISELAEKLNRTPSIIANRISNLEKEDVILGYQAEISPEALGQTLYKCQLYLKDLSLKEEERIAEFCNRHPKVVEVISQVGRCRLELNLHAENYQAYLKTVKSIRAEFPNQIRNTVPLMMHTEHYRWMFTNQS